MASVDAALVFCTLERVFNLLASPILKQFQSRNGTDEDLKDLKLMLRKMKSVLNDAEQKQSTDDLIEEWLVDVRDLVYDAEDVVDLYATQVGRWYQVRNPSHASSSSTNLNKLKAKFEIEDPLKMIIEKSKDLVNQMEELCLKADGEVRPTTEIVRRERKTTSIVDVDESQVRGRGNDKNKIVDLLLSAEPNRGNEVGVLPIVGMGGLGKTTLAQLVYNDEKVQEHFDAKAWVCVSEETDVGRITKNILESLKISCNYETLEALQVGLKEKLNGKRFLIVLDDIWYDDPNDWDLLKKPFRFGEQGSKIIVTTRSEAISKMMGTISAYFLNVLADEDCHSLFWQCIAVSDKKLSGHPNLKSIGDEIVRKCRGLPLAAKTLGRLLQFKDEEDEWKEIAETDIWDLPKGEEFILSVLRLSYKHLPSHLKPCFAYCSIFPKDFLFRKEEVVWMWIAEGFVHFSGRKQIEDTGRSYFDDLVSRSFFQNSEFGTPYHHKMHDLVHDLAKSISRGTHVELNGNESCNISDKPRYSTLERGWDFLLVNQSKDFAASYDAKPLRTFLYLSTIPKRGVIPKIYKRGWDSLLVNQSKDLVASYDAKPRRTFIYLSSFEKCGVISKVIYNLVPTWRCLRVLSLRGLSMRELPDSIKNIRLLRYLDFSYTKIFTFPESIYDLYNLQVLIYSPLNIPKLPEGVHKLINIRYIIDDLDSPCYDFFVGKSDDKSAKLGELKDLIHLTGELSIKELQNVVNVSEAKKANLKNKQHLCKLTLRWNSREIDAGSGEEKRVETQEILECLQHHRNLKGLTIQSYPGMRLPSWILMLSSLVNLILDNCMEIQVLPRLGQLPSLKSLHISYMKNVKHIGGSEFFGNGVIKGFPLLETLKFIDMPMWEEWSSRVEGLEENKHDELFPRLAYLTIKACPKLTRLPFYRITSLLELKIFGCRELTSIPRLDGRDGEEFPSLLRLKIKSCNKLRQLPHLLPSLKYLEISHCQQLGALPRLPLLHFLNLNVCRGKKLFKRVGPLPFLSKLIISETRRLKCLPEELLQSLTVLKELSISACKDLLRMKLHHDLASLHKVTIEKCTILNFSFPEEEGLPQRHNFTSLVHLKIIKVSRISLFSETRLPPNLRKLEICELESLGSLPKELCSLPFLEELGIKKCPGLTSFTTTEEEVGLFPASLKSLRVESCRNLKELSRHGWINHNCMHISGRFDDRQVSHYHRLERDLD